MPTLTRLRDYITGKDVPATPEEAVRQDFEHFLVDVLGYPKEFILPGFPIQRGSRGKRAEQADIAVFRSNDHVQTNIEIIVETKAPGEPFDDQAFSYTTATTAQFVAWFDGFDRQKSKGALYFYRDLARSPTQFDPIPLLPSFGQSLDEIGKYSKTQLRPALSLKSLFQKMHNRLYGEGPLKRGDAIAQEVMKLLFCKIYDELYTPGDGCEFRATVNELSSELGKERIASRTHQLFNHLRGHPEYSEMFAGEELQYDSQWISYIVSELQPFALLHPDTNTDAMGDAYEIFIGPQLKGESGQFFTPREVVHMAVHMLRPSLVKQEYVIDPACGSGGFLVYTLRYVRDEARRAFQDDSSELDKRVREYARSFMAGIDIEPLLHKVARSYMAVVGNGRSGVFSDDALARPDDWKQVTRTKVMMGRFDVLLTNPPFGTKIKVQNRGILSQFDLGHGLHEGTPTDAIIPGQDPAILFLDRSRQLLKEPTNAQPGGRMAIVLPRQITSGHHRDMQEIRRWILKNLRVLAVVDLPRETFQPYTGTLTSLLFAERIHEPTGSDYSIFMAVPQDVGHDRRGNPKIKRTDEGSPAYDEANNIVVEDNLPAVIKAYTDYTNNTLKQSYAPLSAFSVRASEIVNQTRQRMDASYYDPEKNDLVKRIWDMEDPEGETIQVKTIDELSKNVFYPGRHKRNYVQPSASAVPFLSGTNILQVRPFDVKWQPRNYPPLAECLVESDWVLITRSGSTGRVLYIGKDLAGFPTDAGVAVSEHVIRIVPDPEEVDPGYLFAFLSTDDIGRSLLAKGIYASVVEHITPDHVKAIPIPLPSKDIQREIGDKVRAAEAARNVANEAIMGVQDVIRASINL